jgi:hypothetical protein
MCPVGREPHVYAAGAGDYLGGNLDRVGAPGASEPLAQGVTLAAAIEELPALGFIDRGGGQLGSQAQLLGCLGTAGRWLVATAPTNSAPRHEDGIEKSSQ